MELLNWIMLDFMGMVGDYHGEISASIQFSHNLRIGKIKRSKIPIQISYGLLVFLFWGGTICIQIAQ